MLPLTLALALSLATPQATPHDVAFWKTIVAAKFEPPAGTTAKALAPELVQALGSPDPQLRDDLAETILTDWIYRSKRLDAEDLRGLTTELSANLVKEIGEQDTDSVLGRSFSALTLSIVAARHNEAPVLTDQEFARLLDAALTYFHAERDVRGYDDRKGWMHSAAHTADLLKFLARNPAVSAADQRRILAAVTDKLQTAPVTFFTGEDERLARIPISIARRDDLDRAAFTAWVGAMQQLATFPKAPSAVSLRAMQNARHVLAALWTELLADERPSAGADFARQQVREAVKQLF